MLIIGISGSPRKDGNTTQMISWALEKARETEGVSTQLIELADYHINDCAACKTCMGTCIQRDGMDQLHEELLSADGLIFGSPVYFGTMAALIKRFFDRTRVLRHNDFSLADKPVGFISVAARRNGGQETTIIDMIKIMLRHNCVITGNGSITGQFGGTGWAAGKGTVVSDRFGKETAEGVGRRVAYLAEVINIGKVDLPNNLTFDPRSGTPEVEL